MWLRVWLQRKSDSDCAAYGIPRHLHQCNKPPVPTLGRNERLFRRFPPHVITKDIAHAMSFDRQQSSVARSLFSSALDARWDGKGSYRSDYGVVSLPAHAVSGNTCIVSDGQMQVRISVFHDPIKCNYAHCDFLFYENGIEVQVISKGARMRVREMLRPIIRREL